MKVAVIGASGKTGKHIVRQALDRTWAVVAVCRDASVEKLEEFADREGFARVTAPVVSDRAMLARALVGCDAVVVVLMSVRDLKATELVASLAHAMAANRVERVVFTAGEVTAVPEEGETFTRRQRFLLALARAISWLTPFSVTDMVAASADIAEQPGWAWTIVRAPTLREAPAAGYRWAELSDVTSAHALSRADYAASMLDSLGMPGHHRRILTVLPA